MRESGAVTREPNVIQSSPSSSGVLRTPMIGRVVAADIASNPRREAKNKGGIAGVSCGFKAPGVFRPMADVRVQLVAATARFQLKYMGERASMRACERDNGGVVGRIATCGQTA